MKLYNPCTLYSHTNTTYNAHFLVFFFRYGVALETNRALGGALEVMRHCLTLFARSGTGDRSWRYIDASLRIK